MVDNLTFESEPLWKWVLIFALFFGVASLMAFIAKEV